MDSSVSETGNPARTWRKPKGDAMPRLLFNRNIGHFTALDTVEDRTAAEKLGYGIVDDFAHGLYGRTLGTTTLQLAENRHNRINNSVVDLKNGWRR